MTPSPSTPRDALAQRIARDPASPLITYYDDDTGERIELSAISFANWVYKAANLLRDGLGLIPASRIAVDLPVHWQSFAVIHAAWQLGAAVELVDADVPGRPAHADALVRAAAVNATRDDDVDEVLALALRPMAMPGEVLPAHVTDFDREVRSYADAFSGAPVAAGSPALIRAGQPLSHEALIEIASSAALPVGDRLSIECDGPTTAGDLARLGDAVLIAIVRDRGLVLSVGSAPIEARESRRDAERATRWITHQ